MFVHGGWLIPATHQDFILRQLPELRARHHLKAPELKWQQFAKRADGAAAFRDIFDTMCTNAAIPFFQVMDKDYILAAKAVETFLDPEYNHLLPVEFTSSFDVKKELAEAFLLAPGALTDFADTLRAGIEPEAEQLTQIALGFANCLAGNGEPAFAEKLRHFTPEELADMGSEFGADVWLRTTLGHSMFALMQLLERFLRSRSVHIEIVHDNIVRFDALLAILSRMFRDSDGMDSMLIGGETRFFSMPTVGGMRLGDSKQEPFIQLADLLVGFVRTVFTKLKRGDVLSPDERAVCGDLAMLHQEFYSWDVNVPEAALAQFAKIGWSDLKGRFLR